MDALFEGRPTQQLGRVALQSRSRSRRADGRLTEVEGTPSRLARRCPARERSTAHSSRARLLHCTALRPQQPNHPPGGVPAMYHDINHAFTTEASNSANSKKRLCIAVTMCPCMCSVALCCIGFASRALTTKHGLPRPPDTCTCMYRPLTSVSSPSYGHCDLQLHKRDCASEEEGNTYLVVL
jgi:hypothetical protein